MESQETKGLLIKCNTCDNVLDTPGALVFSPPLRNNPLNVEKYHVCVKCWQQLKNFMEFSD